MTLRKPHPGWILALAASAPGLAQELEEVLVTADFRPTDLMQTAGSVSVIGELEMAGRSARHLEDILSAAPNVSWSSGSSRSRFIQLRGVGDLEQYAEPKYYPSVGLVIDDVELGAVASAGMLFDASQVEVLRGPQGTRFGASGHAGMIRIGTHAPTGEFEARIEGGAGNYGSQHLAAIVSGPLGDGLAGRLALQQNYGDGYIDNAYSGDDSADFDELSARARLAWQPGEDSHYQFAYQHFASDNGYDAFSLQNNRTTWSDQPGKDEQDLDALTARGDWALNERLELQAVATWLAADSLYDYDVDWVSPPVCEQSLCSYGHDTAQERFERDREQATLELRLLGGDDTLATGGLRYTLGLYANQNDEGLDYAYPSAWYGLYQSSSRYDTRRLAAYAELEYGLTDNLAVSGGLRLERFSDDYDDSNGVSRSGDEDLVDAELSLQYQLGEGTFAYATLALANKPGGANVAAGSQYAFMSPQFQDFMQGKLDFDGETLFSRELGIKTQALDNRLSLRAALFHASRENAQLENWMWDADAGLWVGYLDSGSDATNYGAELEGSFALNEAVLFYGSYGWLETEVDEINSFDLDQGAFVSHKNREQAKSPGYQYNAGVRVGLPAGVTAALEFEGRDESYYGYYHNGKLDGYDLVNASLGWAGERLGLTLWGRNLADEDYAVHGLYVGADPRDDFGAWSNQTYYQLGAPRTYGLDLSWQF